MPNLVVLIGPTGSGKSTVSQKYVIDGCGYVNQDLMGKDGHLKFFNQYLQEKRDIVVDRMNFNEEQRLRYVHPAQEAGYHIVYRLLVVPKQECMQRMLLREKHPTIKTKQDAERALNFFFRKFEYPDVQEGDEFLIDRFNYDHKQAAIICDLDGTLCNIDHRLHYVQGDKKKDWKSFFAEIPGDKRNEWCSHILDTTTYATVYCSGRSEEYRAISADWLMMHSPANGHLFMRPHNDFRPDSLIKEIILDFEILPRYDVQFAIDDRKSVVDMWRRRGIVCLHCAEGDF